MSDGIVLAGLPGSGKTTVGECVAAKLGRPFIDIDREIERTVRPSSVQTSLRAMASPVCASSSGAPSPTRSDRRRSDRDRRRHTCSIRSIGGCSWSTAFEFGLRLRSTSSPTDSVPTRPRHGRCWAATWRQGSTRTAECSRGVYAAVDAVIDSSGELDSIADAVIAARTAQSGSWRPLLDMPYERHHPMGPAKGRLLSGSRPDASGSG